MFVLTQKNERKKQTLEYSNVNYSCIQICIVILRMQQNAIKLIIVAVLMNNGFIYAKALLPRAKTFSTQL